MILHKLRHLSFHRYRQCVVKRSFFLVALRSYIFNAVPSLAFKVMEERAWISKDGGWWLGIIDSRNIQIISRAPFSSKNLPPRLASSLPYYGGYNHDTCIMHMKARIEVVGRRFMVVYTWSNLLAINHKCRSFFVLMISYFFC